MNNKTLRQELEKTGTHNRASIGGIGQAHQQL
jgi:hypothetical protein